jgi:hypothetical protein
MATSKSTKKTVQWIGGALVFSGRPDPTWPVLAQAASELESLWSGLPPAAVNLPVPPGLGYRGAFLRDTSGREWLAYGGVVTLKAKKALQSRHDPTRQFEKTLLATAPPGLLPAEVIRASHKK